MCSRKQVTQSCLVEKADDDFGRWVCAQQVISSGQGRRAWRTEPRFNAAEVVYYSVLAALVLALLAVAVVRSWK